MADNVKDPMTSAAPNVAAQGQVGGTMPVPGGPKYQEYQLPQNITPARQALQQSVAQDISKGREAMQETGQQLGVQTQIPQTFQEKGIRLGDRVIAQNELNLALEGQKRAIDNFLKISGYASGMESQIAKDHLTERFNKIRADLIKKGLEIDRKLAQQKASAAERRAAAKNFGAFAGTVVGGIAGGYMSGGNPAGVAAGAGMGRTAGEAAGAYGGSR